MFYLILYFNCVMFVLIELYQIRQLLEHWHPTADQPQQTAEPRHSPGSIS